MHIAGSALWKAATVAQLMLAAAILVILGFAPPDRGEMLLIPLNGQPLSPALLAHQWRYDFQVASILGVSAAVQPALLVYLLNGHPWQMEGHMYFFVGLAALTLLCDWRPIAVAVAVIAVHHLLLGYLAPEWVFIGSGDLPRVLV